MDDISRWLGIGSLALVSLVLVCSVCVMAYYVASTYLDPEPPTTDWGALSRRMIYNTLTVLVVAIVCAALGCIIENLYFLGAA